MSIKLYDLAGIDDRRFSSNCWRTRFALLHKGLPHITVPKLFTSIHKISGDNHRTLPIITDGKTTISDSWAIVNYLEAAYPHKPSLFDKQDSLKSYSEFLQHWSLKAISFPLLQIIIKDIYDRLDPIDKPYFRATREKRFGKTLEDIVKNSEDNVEQFRSGLNPLRVSLKHRHFLSGKKPLYPDYIIAAALMWPRSMSPKQILHEDDTLNTWFKTMLSLYEGIGSKQPKEWVGI